MLNFKYKEKNISTKTLESNIGQIPGVHANPRTITKDEYQKLKSSIERNGIIKARSPIVYEHEGRFVVICGNMRLKASKELGLTDIPVFLIDETLTPEQLNELDIIDNKQNGEWDWDILANEWDETDLAEWGVETPAFANDFDDTFEIDTEKKSEHFHMTFAFTEHQAQYVAETISKIKQSGNLRPEHEYGNDNSNANALYEIVEQWAKQKI